MTDGIIPVLSAAGRGILDAGKRAVDKVKSSGKEGEVEKNN